MPLLLCHKAHRRIHPRPISQRVRASRPRAASIERILHLAIYLAAWVVCSILVLLQKDRVLLALRNPTRCTDTDNQALGWRLRSQPRPLRARALFASDHAWCARDTEHRHPQYGKIMKICHGIVSSACRRVLHHRFDCFCASSRRTDGNWRFEIHVDSPLASLSRPLSLAH